MCSMGGVITYLVLCYISHLRGALGSWSPLVSNLLKFVSLTHSSYAWHYDLAENLESEDS